MPLNILLGFFNRLLPSEITSRHQNDIDNTRLIIANKTKTLELLKPCIVNTPLVVKVNKEIQVYNGQGDGETK